ncbi:hypothetical protein [Epilithonimonas hominis]|uniref:hypothetical protein n=1 Tax=Epilithonimonas hominis TaxID=420404 RepID=UPI000ED8C427|nr:hypothetical protein [Epilithonimonas hominis]HAP95411.1 hypothetical protein [Chryseobacterium sp.]
MLDNIKFSVTDIGIINRVLLHPDFVQCRPKNNYYHSLKHRTHGAKLSLDFRKSMERGKVIGYGHLEIIASPHYHFNHYQHNGNDFAPKDCIEAIADILTYLGIEQTEYNSLKVVNIEFGLNIIPESDIKNFINGLLFYKKTPFTIPDTKKPYFKKTDATNYKQIKAYAKGLQFLDVPQYGIHPNTLRFEVKSKQAKYIKKYGIKDSNDLTKLDTYKTLNQTLLNEWENVLLINETPDFSNLKPDEVRFIQTASKPDFWSDLYGSKYSRTKEKYFAILQGRNNLKHLIKLIIIDKIFSFQNVINSTQGILLNSRKVSSKETQAQLINLENVTNDQNNKVCVVTGLDISMQRKGSRFLREKTLKKIQNDNPSLYKDLEKKYLTSKAKELSEDVQLYLICKNIRDTDSNPRNNRARFEERNYPQNQLQFNFNL